MSDPTKSSGDGERVKKNALKRRVGQVLNGKFFPKTFFVSHWGLLLTLVVVFLASIAHRNMYLVQQNKIKKLETELVDCRTDRILLENQRDENLRLHEISDAVDKKGLTLKNAPAPKEEIIVETSKTTGK
ncbi:MAG: hypothetical protein IKM35_05265 [Bacteroidaceae bacterium]|nr:hypothetical protein [Bacteroidaceae bacterium]